MSARSRRWGKPFLAAGGITGAMLLLVAALVTWEVIVTALGGLLIIADPLERADAVVVLSGGDSGRMEEAARLYHERYANQLIITETGEASPEFGSYSEIARFKAVYLNVPVHAIVVTEQTVSDTRDEARAVRKLLQTQEMNSVIVVTDPFHTLRTRLIFRDVFADSEIKVFVRPVPDSWYRSTTWWLSLKGWQMTFNEYVRLFALVFQ